MLQRVGEPVSIEVPTNFSSFTSHTSGTHEQMGGGVCETLCVNGHPSPQQAPPRTTSELHPHLNRSDRVCRSSVFTQEPVKCAAYAHCIAAEWSHPQKVLRGQASAAQHARTTKEPDRWRELYPSYRVSNLSRLEMLLLYIYQPLRGPCYTHIKFELLSFHNTSTSGKQHSLDIVLGCFFVFF